MEEGGTRATGGRWPRSRPLAADRGSLVSRLWSLASGIPSLLSLLLLVPVGYAAAAPGLYGGPGLVLAPTADYVGRGAYAMGVNTVDEVYRPYYAEPHATVLQYYQIGLSYGLDVTMGFMNFDGKLFAQKFGPDRPLGSTAAGTPAGGWNIDRVVSARMLLVRQGRYTPSIAIGMRDLTGTSNFGANYLVASRRFPRPIWQPNASQVGLGLHLGAGTERLSGLFGGVDYSPSPRLTLMLEAAEGRVHAGMRWRVTRQFHLQPSLLGLRWLGGGVCYTHEM